MITRLNKNSVRKARHHRMRRYLSGTEARPRLNVYRSLQHIYAQVINDVTGTTICSASTLDAEVKAQLEGKNKREAARIVGEVIGRRAKDKGVEQVVFDRGGYIYTGRVAALADGARAAGLDF
ncbi:MAG: 50S ribosomal protein L18 [Clostridia bacterium]|nr:50S ribosomal protein L18 [Clostridia bacterium]